LVVVGMAHQGYDLQLTAYGGEIGARTSPSRDRAFDPERHGLGAGAVARGEGGGVGGAPKGGLDPAEHERSGHAESDDHRWKQPGVGHQEKDENHEQNNRDGTEQ
jgi:hypothetical protein